LNFFWIKESNGGKEGRKGEREKEKEKEGGRRRSRKGEKGKKETGEIALFLD
jgi:hypothetical protein